ncbi:MAG: glycosyltransferase, partial [Methanospirillum sp.]|nr:glycosyltransferase [Methanospirillum sp.]
MSITLSVTAVIPVYNDLIALQKAIPLTSAVLGKIAADYEIIIAEDASTDGSAEFARDCAGTDPHIRHLHRDERLGRGSALSAAVMMARGNLFCYFDVDMATDIRYLEELLKAVGDAYDIATGSRLLPGSNITRSLGREIKSRGYNLLVRLLLKSRISDHQCG